MGVIKTAPTKAAFCGTPAFLRQLLEACGDLGVRFVHSEYCCMSNCEMVVCADVSGHENWLSVDASRQPLLIVASALVDPPKRLDGL